MATVRWAMAKCSRSTNAALHLNDALLKVLRLAKGVNHHPLPVHLLRGRREDLIAGGHLIGMDQRLSVHAKGAAMLCPVRP